MNQDQTIVVVGAGLAGSMISLMLAQSGFDVYVYEKRSDPRKNKSNGVIDHKKSKREQSVFGQSKVASKRSINLALSVRGQEALKKVGIYEDVMQFVIPMKERAIHLLNSTLVKQPYGTQDQAIYSVSRQRLNDLLLKKLDEMDNVKLFFEHTFHSIEDLETGTVFFMSQGERKIVQARLIIGADGAYSGVRTNLSHFCRQNFSRDYIAHGYKELTIAATPDGDYRLQPVNALHIWPRQSFMMIALPNPDKTFTCTLFAPYDGEGGLDSLRTKDEIKQHFEAFFPDIIPLMPNYIDEYLNNPTGALATTTVSPWNLKDRVVLLGDAAHAVVPFYGQGMNAAFEDCLVFMETLDKFHNNFSDAVPFFASLRKPCGDALAQLSFNNYLEMRKHTASFMFRTKKKLEAFLHSYFPSSWIPLYTMVSFTRLPYDEVIQRAERQDRILSSITKGTLLVAGCSLVAIPLMRLLCKEH